MATWDVAVAAWPDCPRANSGACTQHSFGCEKSYLLEQLAAVATRSNSRAWAGLLTVCSKSGVYSGKREAVGKCDIKETESHVKAFPKSQTTI